MRTRLLCLMVVVLSSPSVRAGTIDFNRDVKPILSKNCFACHGPDDAHRAAGLRLDERDAAVKKRKSGAAIVPGKPEQSTLVQRILSEDEAERMPPAGDHEPLTKAQISILKQWISDGGEYAAHWSFLPPKRPALPMLAAGPAMPHPIDAFIRAKLEANKLAPNPEADRYTLIRRLSFDLRGLPPTPAEVDAFIRDTAPNAYEKVVDQFLNDIAYGERWARVWLDLARYADSAGYGSDPLRPNMWRYRDWVIDAYNRNQPYDQFTIDQIAGDLLPNATEEQKIATAFHRNTMTNTEGGTDDEEFRTIAVKDRVDTTMQVWMGLTMGCAKCHTHKYDPITQTEYYRFYALFNQTADADRGDESPLMPATSPAEQQRIRAAEARIAELRQQITQRGTALAAEQAKWEANLRPRSDWKTLLPRAAKAAAHKLEVQSNGQVIASGDVPMTDRYTITAEIPAGVVGSIRLDALPKGRNFVLTNFRAEIGADDAKSVTGKFIRVELPGNPKMLSLAEVQVFRGTENIARKGKATQSSTDYDGPAHLAIDGNTDGHYANAKSTTHTANEANPWWELSLADVGAIERIIIWNRTDGVGDRLANFKVSILDEKRATLWERTVTTAPSPNVELTTNGKQPLKFLDAIASYSQSGFPVANALTGKGWAVGGATEQSHWAAFFLDQPRTFAQPTPVTFHLEFQSSFPQHTLQQFGLAVGAGEGVKARLSLSEAVRAALDVAVDKRSPEQAQVVRDAFLATVVELKPLRDEIATLEKTKPTPVMLPIMQELPANQRRKTRLLIKGDFLNPGDPVEPGMPAAFHTAPNGELNRLAVARWLVAPENPLTARVAVNRLWAQLFGVGLVETEEDFGSQGELPSHPELLDWLATEYIALKWDTKAMLKTIVMSGTYKQSATVKPDALAADPRNRLLSRAPRFRLEAEMVRDQALALAGLLSRKTHGPSVFPPQPEGLWQAAFNGQRTWSTSSGEDRYRRGLYTFWRRTVPYPAMATFDAPSREYCVPRRIRTNTPLQAFVTLNDPVFVEAAQGLARRLVREGGATPRERIAYGLKLVLARPGTDAQVNALVSLYQEELERFRKDVPAAMKMATDPLGPLPTGADAADMAAWTVLANVLLNLDSVLTKG